MGESNFLQNLALVVGLLGTGGLAGVLLWSWRSGKYFGSLEEKLGILPKLDNRISQLDSHFSQVTNAIVEIQTLLTGRGFTINQRLVVTNASPTRLTDYGEQLKQESGFHKIMQAEKGFLINLVKTKNPKTNYDIQEYSLQVLKELAADNNPILFPLKNYAYEKGLVLDIILQAAAIVLRDAVMEEVKFDDQTLENE